MVIFTESWSKNVALVLGGVLVIVAVRILQKYLSYFKERHFPTVSLFTNLKVNFDMIFMRKNFMYLFDDFYKAGEGHPVVGYFQLSDPFLLIRDPELGSRMLTRDFSHFHDHGFVRNAKLNPMDENLFNLTGPEWRTLRNKLTPIFTSGKLKWMFSQLNSCTDTLMDVLQKEVVPGKDTNVRAILSRYSVDVISNCAFGFDSGALQNPDCEFVKMAQKIFQTDKIQMMKLMIARLFPSLAKVFRIQTFRPEVNDFFISITKQGLQHRKATKEVRNDFLQLLYELKEQGSIEMDSREDYQDTQIPGEMTNLELTDELLAAQAFVFLVAGWENGTAIINYALYYIGRDRAIQDKLRREIRAKKEKYGGIISYDALKEMTYLDNCLSETLRMESLVGTIFRVCTKPYTLDDGRVIEKGQKVLIPSFSFQKDSKYYSDPNEFIPDRFTTASHKMTSTFLPFGNGPRVCIAQRFAILQVNLALARIFDAYEVSVSPKLKGPLIKSGATLIADPIGGIWLRFKPLI